MYLAVDGGRVRGGRRLSLGASAGLVVRMDGNGWAQGAAGNEAILGWRRGAAADHRKITSAVTE